MKIGTGLALIAFSLWAATIFVILPGKNTRAMESKCSAKGGYALTGDFGTTFIGCQLTRPTR